MDTRAIKFDFTRLSVTRLFGLPTGRTHTDDVRRVAAAANDVLDRVHVLQVRIRAERQQLFHHSAECTDRLGQPLVFHLCAPRPYVAEIPVFTTAPRIRAIHTHLTLPLTAATCSGVLRGWVDGETNALPQLGDKQQACRHAEAPRYVPTERVPGIHRVASGNESAQAVAVVNKRASRKRRVPLRRFLLCRSCE